ncbi:MAG: DEAD/DEAH box helicase family protein [Bacilli bacterium]|nr:DEAD/DEAH box helicase family protein [Bacilli bacterium]
MSLKDLTDLPLTIFTPLEDPYSEAIIPLLKKSTFYERGVAFFHSEWIELAKEGLIDFVNNGGKMKLLTSIQVDEDEFEAIKNGYNAKTNDILKQKLVDQAINATEKSGKSWTLAYLSWLICQNILELKISVHKKTTTNIYHDKVCFFTDNEGNKVCLHGTLNDSLNATGNQELIMVCKSWNEEHAKFISDIKSALDKSWNNEVESFITLDLPDIVKLEFNRLQNSFNPYAKLIVSKEKSRSPRPYQNFAISNLKANDYCGILSMATGTGKTLTSLFAAKEFTEEKGFSCICIVVPQITLIDQWAKNVNEIFPKTEILVCAENKSKWLSKLQLLRLTSPTLKNNIIVITTYTTLIDASLMKCLNGFRLPFLYIFDECHNLGSYTIQKDFKPVFKSSKIGLSATPERWFDDEGTNYVKSLIGDVVFEYCMEEAIKAKKLTSYEYYPILCPLSDDEMTKFSKLTKEIKKQAQIDKSNEGGMSQKFETLTMERARITKKCSSKWDEFLKIFSKYPDKKGAIVYVFDQEVDKMVNLIREKFNLISYGIVSSTSAEERKEILEGFNNGRIDVLVAIKCLDEGVDIPNCKSEFILASSTNPREFIQRRGRVLRLSKDWPDKVATIFDFVTIAPKSDFYPDDDKLAVVLRELPRVSEFVRLSNKKNDIDLIAYLSEVQGLQKYVEQQPWAINKNEDIIIEGESENE